MNEKERKNSKNIQNNMFEIENGKLIKYNGKEYRGHLEITDEYINDLHNNPDYEVIIPEGVKEIGDCVFRLKIVTKIKLPDSLEVIGSGCFELSPALTYIEIPPSVRIIKVGAFIESGIKKIDIKSKKLVLEDCVFSDCYNLENLDLSGVINIGEDIVQYSRFTNVIIDYNKLLQFGLNKFEGCKSITTNIDDEYKTYNLSQLAERINNESSK